jgi:hypothetical protein
METNDIKKLFDSHFPELADSNKRKRFLEDVEKSDQVWDDEWNKKNSKKDEE